MEINIAKVDAPDVFVEMKFEQTRIVSVQIRVTTMAYALTDSVRCFN